MSRSGPRRRRFAPKPAFSDRTSASFIPISPDPRARASACKVDLKKLPAGDHLLLIQAQSLHGARAQCERVITVDPSAGPQILSVAEFRAAINRMQSRPLFSFVVPVYNVAEVWLRRCLDSVLKQRYPHWELCIANDGSSEPHIRPLLEEYRKKDKRIKVVHCEERGHISAASNAALFLLLKGISSPSSTMTMR